MVTFVGLFLLPTKKLSVTRLEWTRTYPNWRDSATEPSLRPAVYVLTANDIRLAQRERETRASIVVEYSDVLVRTSANLQPVLY